MAQCNTSDPFGQFPPGDYGLALQVRDQTDAASDVVTTTFTVIRLRR